MPACLPDDVRRSARPRVAIVGRPNVGKSSIFNRLVGRRNAIVHAARGVTRDRLIRPAVWAGRHVDVVDTGGLGATDAPTPASGPAVDALVRRQIEAAVREADALVLVTDATAGPLPQDEEVVAFLRPSGKPVLLAANKADRPDMDAMADEFARFGFPVFPVSASHNRGLDALRDALLPVLPETPPPPADTPLRVAVVGRPNVGKSSFVNALFGGDRVIVSPTPGTTRDSVDVPFAIGTGADARSYLLTDTAGMRRPGKIRHTIERLGLARAMRSVARADLVALMLDAAQGPTAQDKAIGGRIAAQYKACLVLVNKWDLMPGRTEREYRAALARALPFLDFAPVVLLSATTGYRVRAAVDAIHRVAARLDTRLSTGALNRILAAAVERTPPPAPGGQRLKMYYATQTGCRPITILLFVNHPAALAPSYASYLVHALRRAFDLEGIPVRLQCRARGRPRESAETPHTQTGQPPDPTSISDLPSKR